MTAIEIESLHTMEIDETGASCNMETNTGSFSNTTSGEARGSQVEQFMVKKFQKNADEWSEKHIANWYVKYPFKRRRG